MQLNMSTASFIYETHLHTSEASACARSTGAEMARAYASAGYAGFIVTDHFFNGNTAISSDLSWKNRIQLFCLGYENALREGRRLGLQVFFGWEYGYHGTEFLTYGLGKDFLLKYPDMLSWRIEEYFDKVHQHGGFIVHAHPFRMAPYIKSIRLFPEYVDAVEVINASHTIPEYNEKANRFAHDHRLLRTAGSDAHNAQTLLGGGMAFDFAINSIEEFIQAVRGSTGRLLGTSLQS